MRLARQSDALLSDCAVDGAMCVLKKTLKGYWAVGLDSFCYTVFIKFFGSYYLSRYSSNLEGSTMNANAPKNNCPVKSCPAFSLRWTDHA